MTGTPSDDEAGHDLRRQVQQLLGRCLLRIQQYERLLDNQLVHRFIDRFDVWTEKGCVDAVRHLEESYVSIDRRFLELTQWAKSIDEALRMTAQFMQTPMFHDLLVDGIAPDGTVG